MSSKKIKQNDASPAALTAWVNGRFMPLQEACVSIEDRGFQFADGVYEVIACLNGCFLEMDEHLQRLQRSCAAIDIPLPRPLDELEALIRETYARNPFTQAMLYVQITRGVAARSHLVDKPLTPSLIITSRELPAPSAEKLQQGASAITLEDIRWKRCDIKSIALLASVLGKQQAAKHGADEAFWLDAEGHVLEGCSTNVFAIIHGELVTHPLDHQVLGGITRKLALELARGQQMPLAERPWKLDEPGLSECFMTSTTNAVMPVCHINGNPVGTARPGPITLMLRRLMLDAFDAMRA